MTVIALNVRQVMNKSRGGARDGRPKILEDKKKIMVHLPSKQGQAHHHSTKGAYCQPGEHGLQSGKGDPSLFVLMAENREQTWARSNLLGGEI
jgi:hypothetical protein